MQTVTTNQPPRSWVYRHPVWFGVLLAVIALLMAATAGGFVAAIFGAIKSSGAYSGAVLRAKSSPAVVAELGVPIEQGFFVSGNVHVNGPSGKAELEIPISGPKGKATIYVEATKSLGEWRFDRLVVELKSTGQRVDISDAPPAPVKERSQRL